VALPTGGVPEIVVDGENGLIAKGHDPASLAARMQDAIVHPGLNELGASARRFVERACSIEAMCRAYGAIYREISEN
jgi:glycosyltransferase involved in cell wall biosynthesis